MGIRAGLTPISTDAFKQIAAGGEPALGEEPRYSIDKAWYDFHTVFKDRGPPLSCTIAGDCLHPISSHSVEEFYEGSHDYYVGFMSPRIVRDIAVELSDLDTSILQHWYDCLGVGGYDCGYTFYNILKAAYVDAADEGNAIMICIA